MVITFEIFYNILLQGNLNIAPMLAMTYKYNLTHSFDVTSNVCMFHECMFHGYLCYITFLTHKNDLIISLSNFTEPLACGSWL